MHTGSNLNERIAQTQSVESVEGRDGAENASLDRASGWADERTGWDRNRDWGGILGLLIGAGTGTRATMRPRFRLRLRPCMYWYSIEPTPGLAKTNGRTNGHDRMCAGNRNDYNHGREGEWAQTA